MAATLRVMMKRALMLLVASLFCYTGLSDGAASLAASNSSKAVSNLTSKIPGQYRLKCPDHVIEALGGRVTLQCSLHPSLDLTGYTLDVKRSDLPVNGEVVCAYRNGDDYLDPQMPMYKDRVILVHDDLPRGMVKVQIYPANLSDSGQYKFFVSKLRIGSYVNLTVVSSVQQDEPESFDSSSIRPPAEDVNKPEDHVSNVQPDEPESFNTSSIRPSAEDHVDPEKEESPVGEAVVPIVVPIIVVAVLIIPLGFVIRKCKQKHIKRLKERGMEEGSKQDANATNIPLVQKKRGREEEGGSKQDRREFIPLKTSSAEDNRDQNGTTCKEVD